MKLIKILLADARSLLQLVAVIVGLISATIVTAALSTLLVYSLAGASAEGSSLFFRLMNMDSGLYYMYSTPLVLKKELFQALALFNWIVLVGGFGGILLQALRQYLENINYRLAHAHSGTTTVRTTVTLRAHNAADAKGEDFKKAGNS
ncbi:MAG: hypothetical protein J0M12_14230 [Deltaproteobacteria bacterium]|nr:hypothetical protein [Deltaproteobacteria bacterium]